MSGILSSLGITDAPPDPTAYQNQKEVAAQTDEARAEVKSTLDSVNLAVSTADMFGLPSESLKSLQTQANDLYNSTNLSPAEMEKKRKALDASLAAEQTKQEAAKVQQALFLWNEVETNITERLKQVQADKTTSNELLTKYMALNQQIKNGAAAAKLAAKEKKPIPTTPSPEALQDELEALDDLKEKEEAKGGGLTQVTNSAKKVGLLAFVIVSVLFAALLGGIILSNVYAEEIFWGVKLYYFIYGAIFFPLSLLYCMFRPPTWQATIFPWSIREAVETTTTTERLFTYHVYTAEEIAADEAAENLLAGGRKTLRILAIVMSVMSAVAGYMYGVVDYVKEGELNAKNNRFVAYGYRRGRRL